MRAYRCAHNNIIIIIMHVHVDCSDMYKAHAAQVHAVKTCHSYITLLGSWALLPPAAMYKLHRDRPLLGKWSGVSSNTDC